MFTKEHAITHVHGNEEKKTPEGVGPQGWVMRQRAMENTCSELQPLEPMFERTHPKNGRVPGTGPGRAARLLMEDKQRKPMNV